MKSKCGLSREQIARERWLKRHQQLTADQLQDLGLAYHVSLAAMRSVDGTEQAWSTLACALNVSLLLAEGGNKIGNLPCIKDALDALVSSRERAQRLGKWGFSGDELRLVMRALAIHDEQMASTTREAITKALNNEVNRRVIAGEVFN